MCIIFLSNIHGGDLSIENADEEQSRLFKKSKKLWDINKEEKPIEKTTFLKNLGSILDARKKVLNSFKSNISPLKNLTSEWTKTRIKTKF